MEAERISAAPDRNEFIHYGCGMSTADSWRNFDASLTLRLERIPFLGSLYTKNERRFPANAEYGDIVRGLPVPDESSRAVYCSHVLEHLPLADFRAALRNTYRMLRHGGVFRLVMPDLEFYVREYLRSSSSDAAIRFVRATHLGLESSPNTIMQRLIAVWGRSRHQWLWDFKSTEHELYAAGFVRIRRAEFGDATETRFRDVEDRGMWANCLGVECFKGS